MSAHSSAWSSCSSSAPSRANRSGLAPAPRPLFIVITSAESYFITPLALSKSLQLSPLAVILSILFWGWLWGIAGGLMAAPLLAVMKIVCDQFESLRPWGVLLSADTRECSAASPLTASPVKTLPFPRPHEGFSLRPLPASRPLRERSVQGRRLASTEERQLHHCPFQAIMASRRLNVRARRARR